MRIDLEQFLALTVAIGSIGAVGAALYTAQPDIPAVSSAVDTFTDELELDVEADPPPILTVPVPTPAQPDSPPAIDEAPLPAAEPTSEYIPGPDVEGANW